MDQLTSTQGRPGRGASTLSRRTLLAGLGSLALGVSGSQMAGARELGAERILSKTVSPSRRPLAPAVSVAKPRYCTGLAARSFSTAQTAQRDIISFVVIDFEWWELHAGPGRVNTAFRDQLVRELDWCHSNTGVTGKPLQVRLRPRMGVYAPQWVKDRTGAMRWYTDKGTDGTGAGAPSDPTWKEIPGGTPIWWNDAYASAAYDLYAIIARELGSHPALSEVVMGWPSTQFVEPCNKQFGLDENVAAAVAAGYTDAKDDAMFALGWQAHKALLSPLGVSCYSAYNPPGKVTAGRFTFGNVERCVALMRQQVNILGEFAVLGNNSWAPLRTQSEEYRVMYAEHARLHALGTRISFQSETFEKLVRSTTVRETIDAAVPFGSTGIELPRGCESSSGANLVDPAYARSVCPLLTANA